MYIKRAWCQDRTQETNAQSHKMVLQELSAKNKIISTVTLLLQNAYLLKNNNAPSLRSTGRRF